MKPKAQREAELLEWRRSQELEMFASGKSMTDIAQALKVDTSTVSRDIALVRKEARERQADYIEHELPFRHKLRSAAMDKAIKELWSLFYSEKDARAKKALLDSITDTLLKQAAVDGDPAAIENAIKQVARLSKQAGEQERDRAAEKDDDENDAQDDPREPA